MIVRPSVIASTLASLSVEAFLDDHAVARLTKDSPDHDLIDCLESLAEIVADVDPLAGGQTIGFQDHAQRPPQDEVARLGGRAEHALLHRALRFRPVRQG